MNRLLQQITLYASQILLLTFVISPLLAGTASDEEADFFEKNFLEVTKYPEMVSKKPVPNEDVLYHRAFKLKGEDFEIRIRYEPMDSALKEFKESKEPGSGKVMVSPNNMYQMMFMVCMMNILQSKDEPGMNGFPPVAVKEEFNADAGLTTFGQGKSQFLGKYKFVLAYLIHKENIGDVQVYYLFNNREKGAQIYKKYFYPVKFR